MYASPSVSLPELFIVPESTAGNSLSPIEILRTFAAKGGGENTHLPPPSELEVLPGLGLGEIWEQLTSLAGIRLVVLTGNSGDGKSSLLSSWARTKGLGEIPPGGGRAELEFEQCSVKVALSCKCRSFNK